MMFSLKTALLCLVAVASAAPATTPNPDLHHLETRMAQMPVDGVKCPDGTIISKEEIQYAIGRGRVERRVGFPKYHGNHEDFFKITKLPSGEFPELEEYPIIPGLVNWNGRNQGLYRVITTKGKKKGPFVGVVQHKEDASNSFLLCKPAPAPACTAPTTRSVVRDLWYRATKGKGKGKGKPDASASCKLPKTKPKTKKPKTEKPKTETPTTKKPKTKKTKAKVPKTKGKKKGGKL